MNAIQRTLQRIDAFQQRRKWLAFPFAVVKKFGDDRAGNLAALIAYYGFFSLFPLLLVMVSVLGFLLRGHPDLQSRIINSALGQFPVIGDQLKTNVKVLTGSGAGVVLGVGTVLALWAGLGVTNAAQNAFNDIWDVPLKERPNFLESRLRGLMMLVVLGVITLASTFLSGLGAVGGAPFFWLGALGLAGSLILNLALYLVGFRVLTDRDLSWGDVFPGAAVGALLWTALQLLGSLIVGHQVKNASALYGFFGFVIAMLAWIYLGAQITLYCAEINVVRKNGLWPRSLIQPSLTEADRRTLVRSAQVEERRPEESVDVSFGTTTGAGPAPPAGDGVMGSKPSRNHRDHSFATAAATGGAAVLMAGLVARLRRRRSRS